MIQSYFYGGHTSGLFSKLQSMGAKAVGPTAFAVALCLPYAAWTIYKALYSDGNNPEIWQALEQCACATACVCNDTCNCKCKLRGRGLWPRIKRFFCSSTFVDCCFLAVFAASAVGTIMAGGGLSIAVGVVGLVSMVSSVWSTMKSIKRNFLF